jgi:hypothetical protein
MSFLLTALLASTLSTAQSAEVVLAAPSVLASARATIYAGRHLTAVQQSETADISLKSVTAIDGFGPNGVLPQRVVKVENAGGNQYHGSVDVAGYVSIVTPAGTILTSFSFVLDEVTTGGSAS